MEDITSSTKTKGPYMPIIMISLGAFISACLTLALAHILFIKFCKRRPQVTQTLNIEPTKIGLDKRILNTIPILFYSTKTCDLYQISQGDQCVICLSQFKKGDLIRCLPICGHIFHVSCIDDWFHAHSNCPICRSFVGSLNPSISNNNNNHYHCSNVVVAPNRRNQNESHRYCITRTRSDDCLQNCDKMVFPIEGLSRSLSMDRLSVMIDPRENIDTSTLPSSFPCGTCPPLSKIDFLLSRLNQAPRTRCLQCTSSMAPRQLRNNGVLPY